jgi:hypothetical protein
VLPEGRYLQERGVSDEGYLRRANCKGGGGGEFKAAHKLDMKYGIRRPSGDGYMTDSDIFLVNANHGWCGRNG